jgi:hypothetical protein
MLSFGDLPHLPLPVCGTTNSSPGSIAAAGSRLDSSRKAHSAALASEAKPGMIASLVRISEAQRFDHIRGHSVGRGRHIRAGALERRELFGGQFPW